MNINVVARALTKIQSRLTAARLKRLGVGLGKDVRFLGRPFVQLLGKGSSITIADGSSFVSLSPRTALGLNHPVNLRVIADGARLVIGHHVGMSGGTICCAIGVEIGDGTILGANVVIVDTDFHPIESLDRRSAPLPKGAARDRVLIGPNVFVGTGVTILKGTTIGANSVVGAGAVVKGIFGDNVVMAGNPARVVRNMRFDSIQLDKGSLQVLPEAAD